MKFFCLFVVLICFVNTSVADEAGGCQIDTLLACEAGRSDNEGKFGWQIGIGLATARNVPVYIGAKETRSATFPIPYVTYRSPNLKVGQGGIVARLFDSKKWLLSVSLSGAIPVNSDDASAREGMPDISAIFEFGPSLKYYFWGGDESQDAAFIDINFRQARTIKLTNLKLTSSPSVAFRTRLPNKFFGGDININGGIGYEFVSEEYANEFYGVAEQYKTIDRNLFRAAGGYAGYRINAGVRWQKGPHIVSQFLAFADISDAEYVTSPLIKTTQHLYGGMVYFYLFE